MFWLIIALLVAAVFIGLCIVVGCGIVAEGARQMAEADHNGHCEYRHDSRFPL